MKEHKEETIMGLKKYYLTDCATARMIVAVTVHCKTKRKKDGKNGELIEFHIEFLLLDGQLCFDCAFKGLFLSHP